MLEVAGIAPASLSGRVREIADELDPTLRVSTYPLPQVYRMEQLTVMLTYLPCCGHPAASVLLLSTAGIYALMSVTVSQRRRDIAIRAAWVRGRGSSCEAFSREQPGRSQWDSPSVSRWPWWSSGSREAGS